MNTITPRFLAALSAVLVAVLLAGCSPDPQEQYEDATQALQEAREARDDAQQKLNDKKDELAELRSNLNDAEANLQAARGKVDQASQKVDKTVNDEVLFRTIQRALLDKKNFNDAAISVGVQDRVVTLTGNVPDEDTHQQALKTARSQAGVKSVVDSLQVQDQQSAPDNNKGKNNGQKSSGGSPDQSPPQGDDKSSNHQDKQG